MTVKRKSVLLGILSVLLAFSCVFVLMTSFSKASAAVNDSVYNNLITNGDFETEFAAGAWGTNSTGTLEWAEDGSDNHVGKMTAAGWVQARIWNASSMYDQLYKVSFRLKLESDDADATPSTNFWVRLSANSSNAFLKETLVDVGAGAGKVAFGEWNTFTYYLKVADNRDGTYEVFAGTNYASMSSLGTSSVELTHFNLAVGCGNIGNVSAWYVDDYTMISYGEYTANLVDNGNFETEYDSSAPGGWGYYSQPVRVEESDGNHVGKINVTGGFWIAPRIWNASFMYGKTYRISFNMKLVASDGSTTLSGGGQFLVSMSSNDNAHINSDAGTAYIDIGANSGSTIGSWKTYSYYIRFEKGDTNDVLYTGTTASNLTKKLDCNGTGLSHFNPMIGCGNNGNVSEFYIDDYAMVEVDDNLVQNSTMTDIFVPSGTSTNWGVNSFATTTTERYWDADKNSYVVKNTGGGWLSARLYAADIEFGKLYRMTAEMKLDSATSATMGSNMHFQYVFAGQTYTADIGVGINYSSPTNVYVTGVGYFRLDLQDDGSLVFSYGKTKDTVAATDKVVAEASSFTHIDCQIGSGQTDAWYVDNVAIYCVSPSIYDGSITVLDENGEPLTDYVYEITGNYTAATLDENVLNVTGIIGEISVEISKEGYVAQTAQLTDKSNTATVNLISEARAYEATLTVKDSEGNAVTDFTYTVGGTGTYEAASVSGNVITLTKVLGEVSVTIEKSMYTSVTVTVTEESATQQVTFDKRAIIADPSDYTSELYEYKSFEEADISTPTQLMDCFKLTTFVNGGTSATISVTNEDSHYGSQSLLVNSVGDRLVFRMTRTQGLSNFDLDKTYHVTYWLKGITENMTVTPCVYFTYFVEGDVMTSGAFNGINAVINLGKAVTLSTTEWTKIEIEFSVSVIDGEIHLYSPFFGEQVYASAVSGKDIVDVGDFDLSLLAQGSYYLDDVTFYNTYNATVEVLNESGERVTSGITLTATDFTGNALSVTPEIDAENNVFVYKNIFGVVNYSVVVDGETFTGSTSVSNPSLTLANPYTATVAVLNGAGETIDVELIYNIFAMDGANRIEAVWNEDLQAFTFSGAMGELKVYVYAQGYEQHEYLTVIRTKPESEFRLKAVPSSEEGLRGNTALNGDVEDLSQLEMYANRDYAYPEIQATGANDKWASFAPVLTLSDEAAVGEKSMRISTNTALLAADDEAYAEFMEDNDLDNAIFGDRVSYRAGNSYLLDGTRYCFTAYVKAPATQSADTRFSLIFLTSVNLCNGGAFNLWIPVDITVGNDYWHKIEMYFSYEVSDDTVANATGNYEYGRYKLTVCVETYLDGVQLYDRMGVYDYNAYKDGTYTFYTPGENGEMEGWGDLDTTRHDGIKDQEGGRSFGSISMFEPSFQIQSNNSLLVDGGTITSEYKGTVSVLNKDLTPNAEVAYLRLTDRYTGEVIYLNAADYYDVIDQKYYIPALYHSYSVSVCDADKNEVAGLAAQLISSEVTSTVIEYDYDITVTLKDQNGNVITDVVVRILLANGSYATATNNKDGTYTYSGLSGVRQISFRKENDSENSYTFPSGITVSSAENNIEVKITLKTDEEPETPDDTTKKSGCGSSVQGSAFALAAVVILAGGIVTLRKKKD